MSAALTINGVSPSQTALGEWRILLYCVSSAGHCVWNKHLLSLVASPVFFHQLIDIVDWSVVMRGHTVFWTETEVTTQRSDAFAMQRIDHSLPVYRKLSEFQQWCRDPDEGSLSGHLLIGHRSRPSDHWTF